MFSGSRRQVPFPEIRAHQVAEGRGRFRREVVHDDLGVADLAQIVVADVLIAKLTAQMVDGLIGLQAHGFVYLHLQNQMGAALQV